MPFNFFKSSQTYKFLVVNRAWFYSPLLGNFGDYCNLKLLGSLPINYIWSVIQGTPLSVSTVNTNIAYWTGKHSLPFKWQMIKRLQARIFCLAHGLKILNLCILFLLLSQIELVTRQLKYLISFANSYIFIEAVSVSDQRCQYKLPSTQPLGA